MYMRKISAKRRRRERSVVAGEATTSGNRYLPHGKFLRTEPTSVSRLLANLLAIFRRLAGGPVATRSCRMLGAARITTDPAKTSLGRRPDSKR